MAENTQTFVLVGQFKDNITPSLKRLNKTFGALERSLTRGINRPFKELNKDLREFGKDAKRMSKVFDRDMGRGISKFGDSIKAANAEAKMLGSTLKDSMEAGAAAGRGLKDGIRSAQEEASVLGEILKANALIKVGEGFGNALAAGAQSAVDILSKGMGFVGKQFKSAVADQMEDLQARGSLYGSLKKQGMFKGVTAEEQTADYRQTKAISRANEQAIGQLIRTSAVSTGAVTTLNRQLTDNILPSLLKSKGISDLSGKSREDLDKIFGGKEGIGTDLARLYEQMATLMPSPQYAKMGAMGFTQALTSGTVNRQLAIFENNPVLVEALKTIDGGIQSTADIGKRIQILRKALEVAAPTMMLDEMRNTIAGGMQAVQDTIMNPTVGILSLGADIAGEGKKTLQQYKESGAYQLQMERVKANIEKSANKMELTGLKRREYVAKQMKEATAKLEDALESADSPIEKISVSLAPVLQSFAGLLNTFGNLFIGPVTSIMNSLYKPLAQLQQTFDYLATDVEAGKRSIGEALGRAIGEFFKAIASYFNPDKAGKEIGGGIQQFFADFKKGFDSIDGEKYMKMFLDTIGDIIMKSLFNEGNILKGMTPLGDALSKVFLLLAAPSFVTALISGLVPVALMGIGGMLKGVFAGLLSQASGNIPEVMGDAGSVGRNRDNRRRSRYGKGGSIDRLNRMRRSKLGQAAQFAGEIPGLGYELMGAPGKKTMSRVGRGLGGIGKGAARLGRMVPGGALAMGALDAGMSMMSGQSAGKAIGSAVASTLGAAVGSIFGPVGTMIGGVAGGLIFDKVAAAFDPAAQAMNAASRAMEKYSNIQGGARAGGIEAILANTSAKDLPKVLQELANSGKLTKAEFDKLRASGFAAKVQELEKVNAQLDAVKKQELRAEQLNSADLGQIRAKRIELEKRQQAALNSAVTAWEGFSAGLQGKLVRSSSGITRALDTVRDGFLNWAKGLLNFKLPTPGQVLKNPGQVVPPSTLPGIPSLPEATLKAINFFKGARAKGSAHPFMGNLGEAINYEMKNKPAGSDLVVANSSETIIPAAKGLNTNMNFEGIIQAVWKSAQTAANTMASGFQMVNNTLRTNHERSTQTMKIGTASTNAAINRSIAMNAAGDRQILSAIKAAAAAGGLGGAGGAIGTGSGSLGAASALAQSMGLQITSGFRPGDPGYHGVNRARDYSNGTGPTPQMLKFAQTMAAKYGASMKELIYTPLGFGIKNGKKVAPYATAAHYNHVHVAFANGPDMPTMFTNAAAAASYERMMAPAGAKVATITANSSEASGGHTTVNQNISINGAQDPQRLAEIVFDYASRAAQRVNNASFA